MKTCKNLMIDLTIIRAYFSPLIIFLSLTLSTTTLIAQNRTVYGFVTERQTGEAIAGATIQIVGTSIGVISNNYGFYSLHTSLSKITLLVSSSGYTSLQKSIITSMDQRFDLQLVTVSGRVLDSVFISSKTQLLHSADVGKIDFGMSRIVKVPSLAGEPDLLKALQLLPGVNVANEGTTNLNVRGGSIDQNLVLLDEAPVYNPSHALGFFSAFNPDAIKKVSFYKGSFPVQYGGRLSSVIDIQMKEGNNKKSSWQGSIGPMATRLAYEGPIVKEKSSFILSGRYSYVGHLVDLVGSTISKHFVAKNDINFYDVNAKVNTSIGLKGKMYFSLYSGRDRFYSFPLDESNKLNWGNITSTLRYNYRISSKIFSNTSLIFSRYDYAYESLADSKGFLWKAQIKQQAVKEDLDIYLNDKHSFKVGVSAFFNTYNPGKIVQKDSTSVIRSFELQQKQSVELSAYVSDNIKLNDNLEMQIGFRATKFVNLGPGMVYYYDDEFTQVTDSSYVPSGRAINHYGSFEPRVSLRTTLSPIAAIKVSYARTSQFLHLLSNSSVGLPTDMWLPADRYIKPQLAHQISTGFYLKPNAKSWQLSVEAYFKRMDNIIDYKDNANLFVNPKIETQTLQGNGISYGAEIFIDKNVGKLNGWISYSWSKTNLQINGINESKSFPARYDIRHNATTSVSFTANPRWTFASTFRITSGGNVTIPQSDFSFLGGSFSHYTERNGYRLPVYHRLDLSASFSPGINKKQKFTKQWIFNIFNVYNRKNLFALYIQPDPVLLDKASAFNFYLYGIVPTITFNFKFSD